MVVNEQKLLNRKASAKLLNINQRKMNVKDNISARFKDLFFSTI